MVADNFDSPSARSDESGEIVLDLVQGFPQDRQTWPNQVAAYRAARRRSGTDPPGPGPVHDEGLMRRFASDLSRLLQEQLDQAARRARADMALPSGGEAPGSSPPGPPGTGNPPE